ncbi:MAG: acyl-CoA dehydrogenase family protein [Dehalococcoidia bacterium]
MDFEFTEEEEAFRKEVCTFLKRELPPHWRGTHPFGIVGPEHWELEREMRRKLVEKGWLAMSWPKEYGGLGASLMKSLIFTEEMTYHSAPGRDIEGVGMIGPTLILYGTEEQKRQHLGGIARGEVVWCQGYSEPGSGSDLASLQTRAVLDGDDYVINGQKIWSTYAHHADWMFLLARTDPDTPKHKGITFFLMNMKSPGITVRPLVNMANSHEFNEVFFDNVRVPKENVVGDVNRGWYIGMALLDFERSASNYSSMCRRYLDDVVQYVKEARHNGKPLAEDPLVKNKLAKMAIEIEAARLLTYRTVWMYSKGLTPNYEASMSKLYVTELIQRLANTSMQMLGLYGQLEYGSPAVQIMGRIRDIYLHAASLTLAAGTSEIQRSIIATRGLELPR